MMTRTLLLTSMLFVVPAMAQEPPKQPVYVMLYTQFEDHTQPSLAGERIRRLIPPLERLRKEYPEYRISSIFEFSGAMSEVLNLQNKQLGLVDKVKNAAQEGIVEVAYTGQYEPVPREWPRPDLNQAKTTEERWAMRLGAAENFLTMYKHPYRGDGAPMAGFDMRAGGLKRMMEVFGLPLFAQGAGIQLGGDSPAIHVLRRYHVNAILAGVPDPNPEFAIPGYRGSARAFGEMMSPVPETSPELYWSDNVLHSSETNKAEVRVFSTSEPLKTLKEDFAKLDRSRVHILHMQYGAYVRYLRTWHDGVPRFHPLLWAYDHPYDPIIPGAVPALKSQKEVDEAYQAEEEVLRWLIGEYFPANPGSRFISCADLRDMTETALGQSIPKRDLEEAAASLIAGYEENGLFPANFARAGKHYFSLADMFQLLSTALGELYRKDVLPNSVTLKPVYGPMAMEEEPGSPAEELSVSVIAATAARIADQLNRSDWQPLPANAVPASITAGSVRMNPAQFLRLMAEAYLAPAPQNKIRVKMSNLFSPAGEMFPKQISRQDQGNTWTFKPVRLNLKGTERAAVPRYR